MHDDIVARLASLGYAVTDDDEWLIKYEADKVTELIKAECNLSALPLGLYQVAVDMVCGELLQLKKGLGALEDFDLEYAVKRISEGDTSVEYAVGDGAVTFDEFIRRMTDRRGVFASFRKLRW